MEDLRTYRTDNEPHFELQQREDDRRAEWEALAAEEEVPFHIPRD